MKLVFATHNNNKFEEVSALIPSGIELLSLDMIGCHDEIAETGSTLEENAMLKANFVHEKYGYNCFSDDTGLLVEALNDAPGVFSARYAGLQKSADDNMAKLLSELKGISNRSARFETVIALNIASKCQTFTGTVVGNILTEKRGNQGFGYDPIFRPDGYDETFAELPLEIKNKISHRGLAIKQLIRFLETLTIP